MDRSTARRRVPDQLRKRAALSCDFCKVRRRKCVRTSAQSSCNLCLKCDVKCTSTIPRKPRTNVTNDEGASHVSHHRALADIINKLFPGVDTDNADEISQLYQEIDQDSMVVSQGSPESPSEAFGSEPAANSNVNSSGDTERTQSLAFLRNCHGTPTEKRAKPSYVPSFYERILQSPSGTLSYFGSSSSMAYVRQMRELLATHADGEALLDSTQNLRHTFIKDKYAHTMGEDQSCVPELPAIDHVHIAGQGFPEQAVTRLNTLLEALPPRDETDSLVEAFFDHVHINVALFHRPSFQAVLDRIRSPNTRTIDAGWAVCLRLAVAFGCEWRLSTSRQENQLECERLTSMRRQLVNDSFSEISSLMLSGTLQSVTAFALLSVYMSFANERNAAWVLSGCAIRMAIGLGLHRGENVVRRSEIYIAPLEKELRKQIWCSLYIFEQYTSALFGRPSAVDGVDIIVDLPKESILDQGFYWPPGYLQYDVSLARIIGKVREVQTNQSLNMTNDFQGLPDVLLCGQLLQELDDWRLGLPSFLEFDKAKLDDVYPSHLRQILMIHVRYQYARILLTRPFLLKAMYIVQDGDGAVTVDTRILRYKDNCYQAAQDAWTLVRCLWDRGLYNASLWLDGVFAYQCNLILSLCLLDTSRTSDPSQRQELHEMVKQIQEILHKGPGNRTMRRLIQISRDFSDIVSSASLKHHDFRHHAETGSGQASVPNNLNPLTDVFSSIPHMQGLDPFVMNWDCLMETNIFQGESFDENFMFDPSTDIPFEQQPSLHP